MTKLPDAELVEIRERYDEIQEKVAGNQDPRLIECLNVIRDVPKLLDEVERLRKERDEWKARATGGLQRLQAKLDDWEERYEAADGLITALESGRDRWKAKAEQAKVGMERLQITLDNTEKRAEKYKSSWLDGKNQIERLEKENKSRKEEAYRNNLSKLSDSDFGRIL